MFSVHNPNVDSNGGNVYIRALCGRKIPYREVITSEGIILPSLRANSVSQ